MAGEKSPRSGVDRLRTRLRLHISPGFALVAAALYYLGGGMLLGAVVLADSAHELGHIAALHITGARIDRLRLGGGGAVLECGGLLSSSEELIVLAMGPLAGLIVALVGLAVATSFAHYTAAAALLATGFNLMPALPLDGGRIAWLLIENAVSPRAADVILRVSGCVCAAGIMALGAAMRSLAAVAAGIYLAALVNFPSLR